MDATCTENSYSPRESFPLREYAILTAGFSALLIGALAIAPKRESRTSPRGPREVKPIDVLTMHGNPESTEPPANDFSLTDLLLAGVAAHKISRIVTKDAVTSFVRAPFTRYEECLGYGELSETPKYEEGPLQVLGELLTCNYCMSAWASLGIFWGFRLSPRITRRVTGFFSAVAVSDFLHVIYEEHRTRANVLTLREEQMDGHRPRAEDRRNSA